MLPAMHFLLLALLVACSGSQRGGGRSNDLGCKVDPAAQAACEAKGSGHVYAADPMFLCRGTQGDAKADAEARRNHPCQCYAQADYDERQQTCANTP
jgi:hypothetical protein